MPDHYDVAEICQNGHVTNSMAHDYPASNQEYCDKCGSKTITKCPSCNTDIRGHYHISGVFSISRFAPPSYCHKCGKPFPWTQTAVGAAREFASIIETLTEDERDQLKETIPDLLQDTPRTPVAESKFKKLMTKAGKDAYEGMKKILTDIVSETLKKTLFGPNP